MVELGQLESRYEPTRRNVRVLAVSVEGLEDAAQSQRDFPNLTVLSDAGKDLIAKAGVVHEAAGPGGEDIAMPTTILIDRDGIVKWIFRPDRTIERLAPADLLRAVADHLGDR